MAYNVSASSEVFVSPLRFIITEKRNKNLREDFRKSPSQICRVIGCIALLGDNLLAIKPAYKMLLGKMGRELLSRTQ